MFKLNSKLIYSLVLFFVSFYYLGILNFTNAQSYSSSVIIPPDILGELELIVSRFLSPTSSLPTSSPGQTGIIEGYVFEKKDNKNKALSNAKVEINTLGLAIYTNQNGYYIFNNLPYGFHTLTAQAAYNNKVD